MAQKIVMKPLQTATTIAPMPQAIAEVLKDATLNAVDLAVDEGQLIDAVFSCFFVWLAHLVAFSESNHCLLPQFCRQIPTLQLFLIENTPSPTPTADSLTWQH